MTSTVSVIVPVYNVERYLSECINSIVNQTYMHLEIILVDDGSTDGSGQICDDWAEKDKRIKVIHKQNEGVSVARNTGLLESTGQLIGFVDGDDWLEKEMYELLVERATQSQADVIICGYFDYPYGIERPIQRGLLNTANGSFDETALQFIKRDGYFTSVWNKLYRRESILQNEKMILMDKTLSYGEDEVWLYQVLRDSRMISFVPRALYHWRPREDSITRKRTLTNRKMSIIEAKKKALELLPHSKCIQIIAKGHIYNSLCGMMAIAYITDDWKNYHVLSEYLDPFRIDCILSTEIKTLRKIKMCLLDICMKIKMPKVVVEKIYYFGRREILAFGDSENE